MGRFIEGCERHQALLLADCVDDYVGAENPVRVIDLFVDELDLASLGFDGAAATGRPGYHPATLLKLYLYGYMNQMQSSWRLEREAGRNVEVMWLTGKFAPTSGRSPTSDATTAQQSAPRANSSSSCAGRLA